MAHRSKSSDSELMLDVLQSKDTVSLKKAFTNCINDQLNRSASTELAPSAFLTDPFSDLKLGDRWLQLLSVLDGQQALAGSEIDAALPFRDRNIFLITRAIDSMDKRFNFGFSSRKDELASLIHDGNEHAILAVLWYAILYHQICYGHRPIQLKPSMDAVSDHGPSEHQPQVLQVEVTNLQVPSSPPPPPPKPFHNRRYSPSVIYQKAKSELTSWLRSRLQSYSDSMDTRVFDLKGSILQVTQLLAVLLHSYDSSFVPDLNQTNKWIKSALQTPPSSRDEMAKQRKTCQITIHQIIGKSSEYLGIPPILDSALLMDEFTLVIYLSYFYQLSEKSNLLDMENFIPPTSISQATPARISTSADATRKVSLKPSAMGTTSGKGLFKESYQSIIDRFSPLTLALRRLSEEVAGTEVSTSNGAQLLANSIKITLAEVGPEVTVLNDHLVKPFIDEITKRLQTSQLKEIDIDFAESHQQLQMVMQRRAELELFVKEHNESLIHLEQLGTILKAIESREAFLNNINNQLKQELTNDDILAVDSGLDAVKADYNLLVTSVALLKQPFNTCGGKALARLSSSTAQTMGTLNSIKSGSISGLSSSRNSVQSLPSAMFSSSPLANEVHMIDGWVETVFREIRKSHDQFRNAPLQSYEEITALITENNLRNDAMRLNTIKAELHAKKDVLQGIKASSSQTGNDAVLSSLIVRLEKKIEKLVVLVSLERYRIHQNRKLYKFHKAAQEIENWLTAAKLAILSVPIDLSTGLQYNSEIKAFEDKLNQFEQTVNTLIMMSDRLENENQDPRVVDEEQEQPLTPLSPVSPSLLPSPSDITNDKKALSYKFIRVCQDRAANIHELFKVLRKTVDDINMGYDKAYRLGQLTGSFQAVTATLSSIEKDQVSMENTRRVDKDKLLHYDNVLNNELGPALKKLDKDVNSSSKEVVNMVGEDLKRLQGVWEAARERNAKMLTRYDIDKKISAYTQIADKIEQSVNGLYEGVKNTDLQGKSYQSSNEHAAVLDALDRKYRAFRPAITKMLTMLENLLNDLSQENEIKTRHDGLLERWRFVVESMKLIKPPSMIPKLKYPTSENSASSSKSLAPSPSQQIASIKNLLVSAPLSSASTMRTPQMSRPPSAVNSAAASRKNSPPLIHKTIIPTTSSKNHTISRTSSNTSVRSAIALSSETFTTHNNHSRRESFSSQKPSEIGTRSDSQATVASELTAESNPLPKMEYVPSPPVGKYIPNVKDPLDIAVASIVNDSPLAIKVTKEIPKNPGFTATSSISGGNKYWFGDMDVNGKAAYCRLRGNAVVVRVGGGWQPLSTFLLSHINLETPPGEFRQFSIPTSSVSVRSSSNSTNSPLSTNPLTENTLEDQLADLTMSGQMAEKLILEAGGVPGSSDAISEQSELKLEATFSLKETFSATAEEEESDRKE